MPQNQQQKNRKSIVTSSSKKASNEKPNLQYRRSRNDDGNSDDSDDGSDVEEFDKVEYANLLAELFPSKYSATKAKTLQQSKSKKNKQIVVKIGPEKFKEINMEIISNSTNLIKRICPKTVVLSSSGAIYNIKKSTEAGVLYSDLKKIQEDLIVEACDASGSNLIISRIFNLSGRGIPRENNFALVDFMIKSMENLDLIINSNYSVIRRYSDITQLLKLLVAMADSGQNCVFDSGGAKIELRALADKIIKVVKSKSKVVASEINPDIKQDYYFSDSNSYDKLLIKILGEESLTIENQILNTRNSLFDFNYGTV